MKRLYLVLAILAGLALSHAVKLDFDTDFGLYSSQGAYGNDWTGEGLGNISWTGKFYGSADLQLFKWLGYKVVQNCSFGQTHAQYRDASDQLRWARPEKNADRWDLELITKITIVKEWVDPFFMIRGERVLMGEDSDGNPESLHLSRAVVAYGLSREMLDAPDKKLNLRFGFTGRIQDTRYWYLLPVPDVLGGPIIFQWPKMDKGAELAAEYKQRFDKPNAKLRSNLRLYQVAKKDPLGWDLEGVQPIEVNWENDFTFGVWKCVTANFNFALRYDIEEVDKLQWRQMLGIGIGYIHP